MDISEFYYYSTFKKNSQDNSLYYCHSYHNINNNYNNIKRIIIITISYITHFIVLLTAIKAVTIGSDFNFYLWYKHGKKYLYWYNRREKFKTDV